MSCNMYSVALAGNPNVGKSTIFNSLTGMHQHTGNWSGKTVDMAKGTFTYKDSVFEIIDLPGTYSLFYSSKEEQIARDLICFNKYDCIVIVADAVCLERNLNLVLQILKFPVNALLCVNLMDEAEKKGIKIDLKKLSDMLGIPVTGASARNKEGLDDLKENIHFLCTDVSGEISIVSEEDINDILESLYVDEAVDLILDDASRIYSQCVTLKYKDYDNTDRKLDRLFTSKLTGYPIMFLMLLGIFWITIVGANYPSALLSEMFDSLKVPLTDLFVRLGVSDTVKGIFIDGIYTTLTWVVSVMLLPMAIFFPLFTLLEDSGYLPRVAFNLDKYFKKACAHGKQSITMCMGFGCNACGVTGCRIIDSPRERLIAIITNTFVPCNGRFPGLIALITIFFAGAGTETGSAFKAALILCLLILFGISITLAVSKILSKTILKGIPSSFVLELPPYRKPQFIQVIIRSILDRTVFVLGRAVVVAAPAGAVIWLTANVYIDGTSILNICTDFLDPFASLIGLDGVILTAFILGWPANEIVIPIIIMTYMATGTLTDYSSLAELKFLFIDNGWTITTALCTMLFSIVHFPCATTCLTVYKETKSIKWTCAAFIIPTLAGILVCFTANIVLSIAL